MSIGGSKGSSSAWQDGYLASVLLAMNVVSMRRLHCAHKPLEDSCWHWGIFLSWQEPTKQAQE